MNYKYACPACGQKLFDQGFDELYCGNCETFHKRSGIKITDVCFEQTLLVNTGGINCRVSLIRRA